LERVRLFLLDRGDDVILEEKLGGSSRKWVKGSIAALKKARADIVFLQEENEILRNINEEGENTKSTHGKRVQTLKKKLKEKILSTIYLKILELLI
jgi:hypothetical protein